MQNNFFLSTSNLLSINSKENINSNSKVSIYKHLLFTHIKSTAEKDGNILTFQPSLFNVIQVGNRIGHKTRKSNLANKLSCGGGLVGGKHI